MRILILFISVFSFYSISGQQQSKIDSLESALKQQPDSLKLETYSELVKHLLKTDPKKAKIVLDKKIKLTNKINDISLIAKAKLEMADYYTFTAEFENAEQEYLEVKELFLKNGDTLLAGDVLKNMVKTLMYQGKYEMGLESALESLRINEKFEAPRTKLIGNYMTVGNIQSVLGKYEKSLDYYRKAEQIAKEEKDTSQLVKVRHNLGENMNWLKRYPEGIPYFKNNIAYYKKKNNKIKLAFTYNSLGTLYYEMDSIGKSKFYIERSLKLTKKMGDLQGMAYNSRNLGRIYMRQNNPKKALELYKIGMKHSIQSKSTAILVADYRNVSKAYAATGDYLNAYEYRLKHQQLSDSLLNVKNTEKLNELEIKYQTEKKEAALALQEEEIKTLNEKAKVDRLNKTLYAGGAVGGVLLSGLLFFGFRQRMKKNKIEREKQEEIYKQEIEFKKKELASQTLHLVQKNSFLTELKENLENLKSSPDKFKMEFKRLVMLLKKESSGDKDWEVFKSYFAEVHDNFDNKLKAVYADISEKEIRLASFLKMNLSTKEIADMLNVLPDSVLKSKYRLKKKLNLDKETDLYQYLSAL